MHRVENQEIPGSRIARACVIPGSALVVWPLNPWLKFIEFIFWMGNPQDHIYTYIRPCVVYMYMYTM